MKPYSATFWQGTLLVPHSSNHNGNERPAALWPSEHKESLEPITDSFSARNTGLSRQIWKLYVKQPMTITDRQNTHANNSLNYLELITFNNKNTNHCYYRYYH